MAAKKQTLKKQKKTPVASRTVKQKAPVRSGFFDYFRFSESYTSLILGIIVVIIASVLLMSVVKNRNGGNTHKPVQDISTAAKTVINQNGSDTAVNIDQNSSETKVALVNPSETPSVKEVSVSPSETQTPTKVPTVTAKPKVSPTMTPMPTITKVAPTVKPTVAPTIVAKKPSQENTIKGDTYMIKAGDDLWNIAEKKYNDGYQWVAIAKANNLTNPNTIHAGNVLVLPKVAHHVASNTTQNQTEQQNSSAQIVGEKITGSIYTIKKGDDLWNIAVRAYNGNGYRWVDIAKANNLMSPNLIFSDNTLKLPRP